MASPGDPCLATGRRAAQNLDYFAVHWHLQVFQRDSADIISLSQLTAPFSMGELGEVLPLVSRCVYCNRIPLRRFCRQQLYCKPVNSDYRFDRFHGGVIWKSGRPVLTRALRWLPPIALIPKRECQAVTAEILGTEAVFFSDQFGEIVFNFTLGHTNQYSPLQFPTVSKLPEPLKD